MTPIAWRQTILLASFLSAFLHFPASGEAQTLLDNYQAEIGQVDRLNSSGVQLNDAAAILAQDRANVHRFGQRQAGDTIDGTFSSRDLRARIPALVAQGGLTGEVRNAILSAAPVRLVVQLWGNGGNVSYMTVDLANTAAVQADPPISGAELRQNARNIQLALNGRGFDAGPADGQPGRRTLVAIADFQRSIGAAPTGALTRSQLGVLAGGMAGSFSEPIPGPSFDCGRAGTPVELTICARPELAMLDRRLADAFSSVRQTGGQALVDEQRAWLRQRDACGSDAGCISTQMFDRIVALETRNGSGPSPTAGALVETQPGTMRTGAPAVSGGGDAASDANQIAGSTPSTAGERIVGLQNLQSHLTVWLLGQRPEAAKTFVARRPRRFEQDAYLANWPKFRPVNPRDPAERGAFAEEFVARAMQVPPPGHVTVEVNTNIGILPGGDGFIEVGYLLDPLGTNSFPPVIRQFRPPVPALSNRAVVLSASEPFPLPLSADVVATGGLSRGPVTLRLSMKLDELKVDHPRGTPFHQARQLGSGVMTLETVTLFKDGNAVHEWTAPDPSAGPQSFDTENVDQLARLFGTGVDDQRLLIPSGNLESIPEFAVERGHLGVLQGEAATLALRLGAIFKTYADRPLASDLQQEVLRHLTTQLERDRLLSVEVQSGQVNELERAQAYRDAEPKLRELARARAIEGVLPVRVFYPAMLGEYVFPTQSFPLNVGPQLWAPDNGYARYLRGLMPDALPIEEDAAIALLDLDSLIPGRDSRSLLAEFDYDLSTLAIGGDRSGPIGLAEVNSVPLRYENSVLRIYADRKRMRPLLEAAFDSRRPRVEPGDPLPTEAAETTVWTLLGAMSAPEGFLDPLSYALQRYDPVIRTLPRSQQSDVIASRAAEIRATVPEKYWIGATFEVGKYDAVKGGYVVKRFDIDPVPGSTSSGSGPDVPSLRPADPEDMTILPVPPEALPQAAELIEHNRLTVMLAVTLVDQVTTKTEIAFARPTEVLVGPRAPYGGVARVLSRYTFPPRAQLIAAAPEDGKDTAPPRTLLMSPEATDLLTLKHAPQIADAKFYRRMLIERVLLERAATEQDFDPPWGRFFDGPNLPLTDERVTGAMDAFTSWTKERVKVLPEAIALPVTDSGRPHPETGCFGLSVIMNARPESALLAQSADILGQKALEIFQAGQQFRQSPKVLPGPDRAFSLIGRMQTVPSLCSNGLRRDDSVIFQPDAPYADLVIIARDLPMFGPNEGSLVAASVEIDSPTVRFVPIDQPGGRDGAGLAGGLVVDGKVNAIEMWSSSSRRGPIEDTRRIEPSEWASAWGNPPAAQEVVGLTLAMSLDGWLDAASKALSESVRFDVQATEPTLYGNASVLLNPTTLETLTAVAASKEPDAAVIAIGRSVFYEPGQVTKDQLRGALEGKYGPATQTHGSEHIVWGTPAVELDRTGYCGGSGRIEPYGMPQPTPTGPEAAAADEELKDPYFWERIGWIHPPRREVAEGAEPQCGPVVTAKIIDVPDGGIRLIVWLTNETAAREVFESANPVPEEPAVEIKL